MPKVRIIQTNFSGGVQDPLLDGREDVAAYYNAMATGNNLLVIPQGGVRRRPGMRHVMELSRILDDVDLSGATITAPEGGTAANATDDDTATVVTSSGNIGTTDPFVLLHVDFGADQDVFAVDVVNYSLSSGALDDEFFIQYSDDDSAWTDFGTAFDWDAAQRTRRIRDGSVVSARYWRLARIGSTDTAATASVAEIRFFAESADLSDGRLIPFAYSTEESYMTVATDRNLDILSNRDRVGSAPIPHVSDQMRILNRAQSLDTLFLFHPDVAPQRIFRQGDDDEFDARDAPFENIPNVDYGAGVGGVDEVQTLNDGGSSASGDDFTILLEGHRTKTITASGTRAATAANIQAALRALSNTSSSGITVADDGGSGFSVTFSGDDGKQPWQEMSVSVLTGNSVWTVSRTTEGELPGEPVMSASRGWPRCGAFYQQRLYMGGFKSKPIAFVGSVPSEFYNLDTTEDGALKALFFQIDADQVSAIHQIVPGRNLTFFTADAEYFIPSEPIDEEAVVKRATQNGIIEGIPVFEADGGLLFHPFGGMSIREFLYVDTEQNYTASNISVWSSHLISDPVDCAMRKAVSTRDADLLITVNGDGTCAALTTLRDQTITAFTRMRTREDDRILNVGVDRQRRVYFIVERSIDGAQRRFVEMFDEDLLFDAGGSETIVYETFTGGGGAASFTWSFTNPSSADAIGVRVDGGRLSETEYSVDLGAKTVTLFDAPENGAEVRVSRMIDRIEGLDRLEGETVSINIDGSPVADATVSGGVLEIGAWADTSVQYGFSLDVSGSLLPFRIPGSETLTGQKMRCQSVILSLYETGDLSLRVNNGRWRPVPLSRYDTEILDRSVSELSVTDDIVIDGFLGWAQGAPVEFRQDIDAPLLIRSITREVLI